MTFFQQYVDSLVEVVISGDHRIVGILIDYGLDIIVLYDGNKYIYIPTTHIQHIQQGQTNPNESTISSPNQPHKKEDDISYRKILYNAKGQFVEIMVTGKQSIHGFVTSVLTNYFVLFSPIFKTMFIPLFHVKWLIPYQNLKAPYSLDKIMLPISTTELSLSRTIEEQIKKLEGSIVVFDLGLNVNKIGLLKKVESNWAELVTVEEKTIYCYIPHIKTVHTPNL